MERVVAENISHEAVHELRSEWVVVTAQNDLGEWNALSKVVQNRAELNYCPEVTVITKRRALLNVKGEDDRTESLNYVRFILMSAS